MTSPKAYSVASALIAAASLSSFVAPFVLSATLANSTKAAFAQAPWLLIGVALASITWLFICRTAIDLFFRFSANRPMSIEAPNRLIRFALCGIPGLLRSTPGGAIGKASISSTPTLFVGLCAFTGFAGALAADGLVQLLSESLIMPPIALSSLRLVLGAAIAFLAIAPAIETVVMVLILELLRRLGLSGLNAALLSAAAWSSWHAFINHPLQAPSIFWLFWVLGTLYIVARPSMSATKAGILVAGAHAGSNALALLFILIKQSVLSA